MHRYEDCYAEFSENVLRIGNDRIERTWQVKDGKLINVSLTNKRNGDQWLDAESGELFHFAGLRTGPLVSTHIEYETDDDLAMAQPHLLTRLSLHYRHVSVLLCFRIAPQSAWIRQEIALKKSAAAAGSLPADDESERAVHEVSERIMLDANNASQNVRDDRTDVIDSLRLNDIHCRWASVQLKDQTDTNNNIVRREEGLLYPSEKSAVQGNVLFVRKTLTDSGLLWIKEAPTPQSQLQYPGADFQFAGRTLKIIGSGMDAERGLTEEYIPAYGSAIGVYIGDTFECLMELNKYHQLLHPLNPERDVFIMSNTWGDRSQDGRVSESFMRSEIEAAHRIGITHVQIDDGWQQGVTVNSVESGGRWSGFYQDDTPFWSVHAERFPNGLEPIVELAQQYGIQLGLWFSPDSSENFKNWEKDVETILHLYRTYHVRCFKLDSINIQHKLGELRLYKMMRRVIEQSEGKVYFNLDTTAQVRLGYFGKVQYGGIFLENRYTAWRNYYPHWTLRNLWLLSKYVPASKLQMEFLNTAKNRALYGDDPLAPDRCGIGYAFAVTMFANPLAWMELSDLDARDTEVLKRIIQAYTPVHADVLSGHILPIGAEPSGTSWSGLQSITNEHSGYFLIFREYASHDRGRFRLWNCTDLSSCTIQCLIRMQGKDGLEIAEERPDGSLDGELTVFADGEIEVRLDRPFSFALFRYEKQGAPERA